MLALALVGHPSGWRDVASLLSCVQPTLDISHLSQGAPSSQTSSRTRLPAAAIAPVAATGGVTLPF